MVEKREPTYIYPRPIYIVGVTPVQPLFTVPFMTPWEEVLKILPRTTTILLSDGSTLPVTLHWETTYHYFPYAFGDYVAVGSFELPEGVRQLDPPVPQRVTTIIRVEPGPGWFGNPMSLSWEGFNQPGTYKEETLVINGAKRTYYYYVPSTYDGSKPMPLVFDLHGGWCSGLAQWVGTRSDRYAEKDGFICVAPNLFETMRFEDDVAFVNAIIDRMKSQFNIDARRIYAWGVSGGGVLATYLLYNIPDKIAGVGIVSATPPYERVKQLLSLIAGVDFLNIRLKRGEFPPKPRTIVMFAGTKESILGPPWWDFASEMLECAKLLAQHYKCNPEPEVTKWPSTHLDLDCLPYWVSREDALTIATQYPTSVTRYWWSGGINGVEVIAYVILEGGHVWPGGTQYVTIGTVGRQTYVIDATDLLWKHLSKHVLPG
ncbi:MAG: PHB depolymerase family esterase [Candidatus Nezhaarchaeales archaeon]